LPVSELTLGKRLRCPRCKTAFSIASESGATGLVDEAKLPTTPELAPAATKPDLPPPRTRPQPVRLPQPAPVLPQPAVLPPPRPTPVAPSTPGPSAPPGQNRALLLGLILGGFLLLAGGSLGLAWHFSGIQKKENRQASASDPNQGSAELSRSGETPHSPSSGGIDPTPRGLDRTDRPDPTLPPRRDPDPRRPDLPPPPQLEPQPAQPQAAGWNALSKEDQEKVNKAIDKGVAYLKANQVANGSFGTHAGHTVGYTALPGLVLLECGVKPDDPAVRKAAKAVRDAVPKLTATYELGLAILFLDRLGDKQDDPLIQKMALRLISGQTSNGGWTYQCPLLDHGDDKTLLTALQQTRPRTALDLVVMGPNGKPTGVVVNPDGTVPGKFTIGSNGLLERVTEVIDSDSKLAPDRTPEGTVPVGDPKDPTSGTKPIGDPKNPKPADPTKPVPLTKVHDSLPMSLKKVPALIPPSKESPFTKNETSDNSNTQFATLGLWAAGRHGVPTERALGFLVTRFRTSHAANGAWNYHYVAGGGGGGTPSMTCAGLLGLAVGHGLIAGGTVPGQKKEDKDIEKALAYLGPFIEQPLGAAPAGKGKPARKPVNLYFLWSLERVGVLYNLSKIAGKDWYAWAADALTDSQLTDGHWYHGGYPGSTATIDTCLALLVLKRANLAKDLSQKLEFLIEVKGIK
jgi:hypothetical protein